MSDRLERMRRNPAGDWTIHDDNVLFRAPTGDPRSSRGQSQIEAFAP
jgi:hypothetical protein